MTFRGFAKNPGRKRSLTASLASVGTVYVPGGTNGLSLTLVAADGTRAQIEIETAEWRAIVERVTTHQARGTK